MRSVFLGAAAIAALTITASADAPKRLKDYPAGTKLGTRTVMVVTPPEQFNSSPAVEVSNVLYLNRCTGGCTVTGGTMNDARQHISTIPPPGSHIVGEYKNNATQIGSAADAEWNMVVQCVQEIYSPFNVVVVGTTPTGTGNYNEAIVGGIAADIGQPTTVGGIAPGGCDARDNAISYTFANSGYYFSNTQQRVWEICGIVGQESAHVFGLDHSFVFSDNTSACNDPMTYRTDCGGQKFFRNKAAKCGEGEERECYCGGLQNTHIKLLGIFGAGTSLIPPPTVLIEGPLTGGSATEMQIVAVKAGSKRGVERVELYLNNYKWADAKGALFGGTGQPNPANYTLRFPAGVPNGVIDIVVKAYDDLGIATSSSTVTVTKGAPCANADACAKGQKCEAGKCFWDPPTGKLGDACDFPQFCETNNCLETQDGGYCSQNCIVGVADSCPMTFTCENLGNGAGACLPVEEGGCCSVGNDTNGLWLHVTIAGLVLGLLMRRRRRRA